MFFKFAHVKGHQDGRVVTALPRIAWMNIAMDLQAKQAIRTDFQGLHVYQIPGEGWICYIKQTRTIKHLPTKIWHHVNSIAIQEHWEQKGRFGRGHTNLVVDWDMAKIAIRNLPATHRKWVSKAAANFLPYGENMKWWKF